MKRFLYTGAVVLILASGLYAAFLYSHLRSTQTKTALLREQLSDSDKIRQENEKFHRILRETEELELLRNDNAERSQLRNEVARLQAVIDKRKRDAELDLNRQVSQLQSENVQLRGEIQQLEQAPETIAARQTVDASELMEIGQAIGSYARMNDNRLPQTLSELRSYTAANVFPALETNRFEILFTGKLTQISDPAKTPLARTKSKDAQNQRPYLFADGHVEIQSE
jgi:prepilin-type processing-associated H-X9-DG protein